MSREPLGPAGPTDEEALAILVLDAPIVPAGDVVSLGAPSIAWVPRGHDIRAGSTGDDDDWAFVGWGAAATITGVGPGRFDAIRAAADRLWARVARSSATDIPLPFSPRLFGGFAFDAARAESGRRESNIAVAWRAFGDAAFVLPEMLYSYSDERAAAAGGRSPDAAGAFLVAFVPEAEIPAAHERLEALRRSLEALKVPPASTATVRGPGVRRANESRQDARRTEKARGAPYEVGAPPPVESAIDPAERAYADIVARAVREIERGAFQKVVLCRARRIDLPSSGEPNTASAGAAGGRSPDAAASAGGRSPDAAASAGGRSPDVTRAFAHLDARHTSCIRFLFTHGSSCFLGATPERLVLVRGRRVVTEALAGTLPRHPGEAEGDARKELLASTKDRAEHAFVVAAIRESLAPACEALSIPDEPVVRSLSHVHHLATPIAGLLTHQTHALDVAARLHPTPALCGSPKPQARAFLLAHEAQPRGWYGGGVGWFDREGDGSFGVAIRSALVAGSGGRSADVVAASGGRSADVVAASGGRSADVGSLEAWIYAGAGVVRGSDPERELAETISKERAMREALEVAFWPPAEPETLDASADSGPNNPAPSAIALNSPAPSSGLSSPVAPLVPGSPEAA